MIDIWQGSEYASISEYASATQDSVENGHHIPRVLNILGLEYTTIRAVQGLHRVLCKLYFKDSWYLECLEF